MIRITGNAIAIMVDKPSTVAHASGTIVGDPDSPTIALLPTLVSGPRQRQSIEAGWQGNQGGSEDSQNVWPSGGGEEYGDGRSDSANHHCGSSGYSHKPKHCHPRAVGYARSTVHNRDTRSRSERSPVMSDNAHHREPSRAAPMLSVAPVC